MNFRQLEDPVFENSYCVRKVNLKLYIHRIKGTCFCNPDYLRFGLHFHHRLRCIDTNWWRFSEHNCMDCWVIYFWELWEHQVNIVQIGTAIFIKQNSFKWLIKIEYTNHIWAELYKVVEVLSYWNFDGWFSYLWTDCF